MVIRTIANKVGTIEISGNSFYFLQPLSTFNTDQMEQIQQAYERRMDSVKEKSHYLTAKSLSFQSGQVQFEYDLTGLKAFDYLKSIYFEEKLPYYLSLISIAKETDVTVLWQKENFVVDVEEQNLKAAILENNELKVQNAKKTVDAVKELIIVSLTSLDQVFGRPKRSDFFEQNEEVIRFAEMIYLRLDTLDDLEVFVSQVYAEINERKRLEEIERESQAAEKKHFAFNNAGAIRKFNFLGGQKKVHPAIQDTQSSKGKKKRPDSKESNVRFLAGAGGILIVAFLLNGLLTSANEEATAGKSEDKQTTEEINLEETYRQGLLGDEATVIETLEATGYDSLEKEDRKVLDTLYVKNGAYEKALENNPSLAGEIAVSLAKNKELEKLEAVQVSLPEPNPEVDFELAAASKEWPTVLDLRNQVELTELRLDTIVTAFIQTEDLQKAKEFVEEKAANNEELLGRVLEAEKRQNELAALKREKAEKQKVIDTDTDKKKVKVAQERLKVIDQEIKELMESVKNG
ncbi:hypothetical protein [Planococcus donghaensis]|uniref:hypothetical protein n=1 Tax=Planococcus donghaensis TaxID=414778 RepID=UPI003736730A